MIISFGRKFVFVHIPKTGGTALSLALEARAMKDDILIGDTPKARRRKRRLHGLKTKGRLWKHSTLSDIDGLVSPGELEQLYCFTLVRNPWDRVVSYYHWLQDQNFEHPAVDLAKTLDFNAFVQHPATLTSFQTHPAAHYLVDATGQDRSALFIRLEHFDEDSQPLFQHLGFRVQMSRANPSKRDRDWRPYYSDAAAQALAHACTDDITQFGYTFDDPIA